jgi:hypothetical protein
LARSARGQVHHIHEALELVRRHGIRTKIHGHAQAPGLGHGNVLNCEKAKEIIK